ncbi:MAG TPA: DUF1552 domain-containing protein [Polyangiales bacterium]|nr:DUF1552 domain-containing protein [Polyangiales bacterium]
MLPGGRARAATAPTRFVVMHVPEGMWTQAQKPTPGSTNLGTLFAPLQSYQSKMNVLMNLDIKSRDKGPGGDGHHRGVVHMLTGTEQKDESNAGGASIDQKIASKIGAGLPFASLQFAVRIIYADTNARPIWSGPGKVMPAMQSPFDAYSRIFAAVPAPSTPTAPKFDLRRSALDYALAETAALRGRLGTTDRDMLDTYQESLRDIERRLGGLSTEMTVGCSKPTLGASIDVKAEPNYPTIGRLQMDMLVASLQCGLTRVASLQWGNSNDQCTYSWLGVNTLGHDMSHNNNNCDADGSKKAKVFNWYAQQTKYLLDKLSAIPEGDGTMLDNTVVLWASEFSDSMSHSCNKLMWTMFGNAGGYFKTGRVIDCGGRSVNDLHTSLQNAFGIADTTFGNPAYCGGALPLT